MRRLYLQIYLTLVGSLLLFGLLAFLFGLLLSSRPDDDPLSEQIAQAVTDTLPALGSDAAQLQKALDALARRFSVDVTVRSASGALLGAVGEPLFALGLGGSPHPHGKRFWHPPFVMQIADGRWVLLRQPRPRGRGFRGLGALVLLAFTVAIAAYPVVRRLTGRLERLEQRVEALGEGDLSARVTVEGRDEVADLARSFNRAAERIERLVDAQSATLASASHELRSPLARIRMALALLDKSERPELEAQVEKDIAELDALIDELLLASRLRAEPVPQYDTTVDVLDLLVDEAERVGAQVRGESSPVRGDARLLRRMIRNLLENAVRYAAQTPIEAEVVAFGSDRARLEVVDRGPGVADDLRERIFEPFYRPPGMRESGEGVGLGLALVRQIAERHNGSVQCIARDGGGSRFVVELGGAPA